MFDIPEVNRRNHASYIAKKLSKMFPKYSKKSFSNLVTGDETWVYFFERKRKCSNSMGCQKCCTPKYCYESAWSGKYYMYF